MSDSFFRDSVHRLLTEAVRMWVIPRWLASKDLPESAQYYVYPDGPVSLGWGNAPGAPDPDLKPLRGKRIVVRMSVEDMPGF